MDQTKVSRRLVCRRTDIARMFFGIANAIRQSGRDMFITPTDNGVIYTFRLGNRSMTYTVQEGGEA